MKVSAFIPPDYIQSYEERIDIYKKIAEIETAEDAVDLKDEHLDRYGVYPGADGKPDRAFKIKTPPNSFPSWKFLKKTTRCFCILKRRRSSSFSKSCPGAEAIRLLIFLPARVFGCGLRKAKK